MKFYGCTRFLEYSPVCSSYTCKTEHSTWQSLLDIAAVPDCYELSWDLKESRQELHVRTPLLLSCLGWPQVVRCCRDADRANWASLTASTSPSIEMTSGLAFSCISTPHFFLEAIPHLSTDYFYMDNSQSLPIQPI